MTNILIGDTLLPEFGSRQHLADNENDEGSYTNTSEMDVKIDPSLLKSEVPEELVGDEDQDSVPLDPFLLPKYDPFETEETELVGYAPSSNRKSQQGSIALYPEDQGGTSGLLNGPKLKKSVKIRIAKVTLPIGRNCFGDSENENTDDEDESEDKQPVRKTRRNKGTERVKHKENIRKTTKSRRKKVSEMTPEELDEARSKWRDEARRIRASRRSSEAGKGNNSVTVGSGRRRRKKASQMTPEELENARALWREEKRRARAKENKDVKQLRSKQLRAKQRLSRENMTEEERKTDLAKRREHWRRSRDQTLANLSPDELERRKRQEHQKRLIWKLHKRSVMTEEEKEEEKHKRYFWHMARLAKMSPEELEEYRKRKRSFSQLTDEEKARKKEVIRRYWERMTPEEKTRRIQCQNRRKMERLKQDPEKYAKWYENHQKGKRELSELWRKFRKGVITEEEKVLLQSRMGKARGAKEKETLEQRLERMKEAGRRKREKLREKGTKEKKGSTVGTRKFYSRLYQTETPDEREHRLMLKRIDQARRSTRKQLQAMGVSPEEIERKLTEVEAICRTKKARPFKRRLNEESNQMPTPASSSTSARKKRTRSEEISRDTGKSMSRRGRKPMWMLGSKNSECETPLPPGSTDAEVSDPCSGSSLSSHLQLFPPPQYQYPASPQFQVPFIHTINPFNQPPPKPANDYHRDPEKSYCSNSQLNSKASRCNYSDNQNSQDYCSPESYEPMESPAHSYPETPSPPHCQEEDFSESNRNNNVYITPTQREQNANLTKKISLSSEASNSQTGRGRRSRGPHQYKAGDQGRKRICDVCGGTYHRSYLSEHKLLFHNPKFVDGRCQVCDQQFMTARDWYFNHYRVIHLPNEPRKETIAAKRKQAKEARERIQLDPEKSPFLCNHCGKGYPTSHSLNYHEKFAHGELSKEENFPKCQFCGIKFKRQQWLDRHVRLEHGAKVYSCEKCGTYAESYGKLLEHMKKDHENSSFPCDHCGAVQLSEIALKFHTSQCKKVPREELTRLREKWKVEGEPSLDAWIIGCEFCSREVAVGRLLKHYKEVHGLKREDKHICKKCGRGFSTREFYICHLTSVHEIPKKECLDMARPYNVQNRDGLVVKKGVWRKEESSGKKRGRRKQRKEMNEKTSNLPDGSEREVLERANKVGNSKTRRGRKSAISPKTESRRTSRKSALKGQTRIRRFHKELSDSDDDDDDDHDEEDNHIGLLEDIIVKQEVEDPIISEVIDNF